MGLVITKVDVEAFVLKGRCDVEGSEPGQARARKDFTPTDFGVFSAAVSGTAVGLPPIMRTVIRDRGTTKTS